MKKQIALGFQNTVDFELAWEAHTLERLIEQHGICKQDIRCDIPIQTERDLLLVLLSYMMAGTGSERTVRSSEVTRGFASHFSYQVTLGGTAIRAAIAMSHIGVPSTVHACSLNRHFTALIPDSVSWIASVPDEGENFHPHVILQYPLHAHIHANDIDFTTQRANRVIFAHDPPSEQLYIHPGFAQAIADSNVFLAASYNVIREESVLRDRLRSTIDIIRSLPADCVTVMEDACFESPRIRQIVTDTLSPYLHLFSMNEDELQDRAGQSFDLLDPKAVAQAIQTVYRQIQVPILVCHTAYWALAYGQNPESVRTALESGIAMAATRFRLGDHFSRADFEQSKQWAERPAGISFSQALARYLEPQRLVCLPGKDLDQISRPTTIGLGDAFIGGMLPALLP